MQSRKNKKILAMISFLFVFYATVPFVFCFAQTDTGLTSHLQDIDGGKKQYVPLEQTAINAALGTTGNPTSDLATFIKAVYNFGVAAAAALAVLMIAWGGIEYMTTDAFYGKSEAKGKITGALWGLLLVLSSYLILFPFDIFLFPLCIFLYTK